jgi:mannose-6-phosphate isomerase class I
MPLPPYDRFPTIAAAGDRSCWRGWTSVCSELTTTARQRLTQSARLIIAIECYPGVHEAELRRELSQHLHPNHVLLSAEVFKSPAEIDHLVSPYLGGNDPLFAYFSPLHLIDFLDPQKLSTLREKFFSLEGLVVVMGPAATLCCTPDILIYSDMPRWEGQLRQRRNEVSNLGVSNANLAASLQYKRSFFVDWRVCDRLKQQTLPRWDYLLDTTIPDDPKLITGDSLRATLDQTSRRPFRVVPFFDPAPWGGQWLKHQFNLDATSANYGWGFDCVPEENSLLIDYGSARVEIPSLNLIFHRPRELLGDTIFDTLGPEFPIRFDFLDTIQGGNLSLQVHPTVQYAREQFGLPYTQDESYYIIDAEEGASVFLGLHEGINPDEMIASLEGAQAGGPAFPAGQFVANWPARKHDHFLIPAGTVHCSGKNTVVLEISATPYIFTFKLWDWSRLGLDGLPRPINIDRGKAVIQWKRDQEWVRRNLVNQITLLAKGTGWREERTGLHELEFIETRRHWFTSTVPHDTQGNLNVLNLVEGEEAIVESPHDAFAPILVHYCETFIVPAATGPYTIRAHGPSAGKQCATIKAFVRDNISKIPGTG